MGKRKVEDVENTAGAELAGSLKKRRLSEDEATVSVKPAKKEKKNKKERKVRPNTSVIEEGHGTTDQEGAEVEAVGNAKPKSKKNKKTKKDLSSVDGGDIPAEDEKAVAASSAEESKPKKDKQKKAKKSKTSASEPEGDVDNKTAKTPARFIAFIGNLPYSATKSDIEAHFSSVHPTSVRLMHEKSNPTKSRGIAFIEFARADYMDTCLKLFHHSTFTCQGRDHRGRPKTEERKINVELTAGGGGNTENRRQKIQKKNEKLNKERERRAAENLKTKLKKEKERLVSEGEQKVDQEGVHPSRRARVPMRS
jgi:nucleolar protein 6